MSNSENDMKADEGDLLMRLRDLAMVREGVELYEPRLRALCFEAAITIERLRETVDRFYSPEELDKRHAAYMDGIRAKGPKPPKPPKPPKTWSTDREAAATTTTTTTATTTKAKHRHEYDVDGKCTEIVDGKFCGALSRAAKKKATQPELPGARAGT